LQVASEWFAPAFQNKTDKTQTHGEAKALSVGMAHKQKQNNLVSSSFHDYPCSQKAKLACGLHSDIGMQKTHLVFCSLNSVYG